MKSQKWDFYQDKRWPNKIGAKMQMFWWVQGFNPALTGFTRVLILETLHEGNLSFGEFPNILFDETVEWPEASGVLGWILFWLKWK